MRSCQLPQFLSGERVGLAFVLQVGRGWGMVVRMARNQVQSWLSLALLTLFSSCGESYSEANQGHVCAQGPSKSEAIRRWFVYSYFGVDSVESELPGLGDRFSSKGWLGVETEDVGAYALFVEASRNGDLRVCQPYPDIGLLSGAVVKPQHLLAFVRSKGRSVEGV